MREEGGREGRGAGRWGRGRGKCKALNRNKAANLFPMSISTRGKWFKRRLPQAGVSMKQAADPQSCGWWC